MHITITPGCKVNVFPSTLWAIKRFRDNCCGYRPSLSNKIRSGLSFKCMYGNLLESLVASSFHGGIVSPSGRLPPDWIRPCGSFDTGIPAELLLLLLLLADRTALETGHPTGPWWSDATARAGYAMTTTTIVLLHSMIGYWNHHVVHMSVRPSVSL